VASTIAAGLVRWELCFGLLLLCSCFGFWSRPAGLDSGLLVVIGYFSIPACGRALPQGNTPPLRLLAPVSFELRPPVISRTPITARLGHVLCGFSVIFTAVVLLMFSVRTWFANHSFWKTARFGTMGSA